jgi:hypothetical protein
MEMVFTTNNSNLSIPFMEIAQNQQYEIQLIPQIPTNSIIRPGNIVFQEYIAPNFSSSQNFIDVFLYFKSLHPNEDLKKFLLAERFMTSSIVLTFDAGTKILYQFLEPYNLKFKPILFSETPNVLSEDFSPNSILAQCPSGKINLTTEHTKYGKKFKFVCESLGTEGSEFFISAQIQENEFVPIARGEVFVYSFDKVLPFILETYFNAPTGLKKKFLKIILCVQKFFGSMHLKSITTGTNVCKTVMCMFCWTISKSIIAAWAYFVLMGGHMHDGSRVLMFFWTMWGSGVESFFLLNQLLALPFVFATQSCYSLLYIPPIMHCSCMIFCPLVFRYLYDNKFKTSAEIKELKIEDWVNVSNKIQDKEDKMWSVHYFMSKYYQVSFREILTLIFWTFLLFGFFNGTYIPFCLAPLNGVE